MPQPIETISTLADYGLSGLVIAALFAFIWFLIKEHKAERLEWIAAYREQSRIIDERQTETNSVIRELVSVVRESSMRYCHTN